MFDFKLSGSCQMYVFKTITAINNYFKKCNVSFKDERNHTLMACFSYSGTWHNVPEKNKIIAQK